MSSLVMSTCVIEEDWEKAEAEPEKSECLKQSLLQAVDDDKPENIKRIFSKSFNFNTFININDQETTPLMYAISKGKLECVKCLLSMDTNVNFGWNLIKSDIFSFTRPLHHAIGINASSEIVDVLLQCGNIDLNLKDGREETPFTVAFSKERKDLVRTLLRKGYMNMLDDMCWLIKRNRPIYLNCWYEFGIDELLFTGSKCDLLAHCASYNGNEEVLKRLIQYNYNITKSYLVGSGELDSEGHCLHDGFTLLHVAVLGQHIHIIRFLVKAGCDVNQSDMEGLTAGHFSAIVGNIKILQELITYGADLSRRTNDGRTALHIAIQHSHAEFAKILIDYASSVTCSSLLGLAVFQRNWELSCCLLKAGVCLNGLHEIHASIVDGNTKLANLLLSYLPDKSILKEDKIKDVPTLHFLSDARVMSAEDIVQCRELVKTYIAQGYDINQRSFDFSSKKRSAAGFTALLASVDRKNINLVNILIANGANVHLKDDEGYSPLHWCALVNDSDIMEILLSAGADYNEKTNFGLPIIHVASDEGHVEVVYTLLQYDKNMINLKAQYRGFLQPDEIDKYPCRYNIDVTGEEVKWCTPFQRAVYMSKIDVTELLISRGAQMNGLEELHYSVRQGDTPIANVLLRYIPESVSLADDTIKNEPALLCLPCRCFVDDDIETMGLITGYMERGYKMDTVSHGMIQCRCTSTTIPRDIGASTCFFQVSLLHLSVIHDNIEITGFLLDKGIDINIRMGNGGTPLFLSVCLNLTSHCSYLISKGADITSKAMCFDRYAQFESQVEISPLSAAIRMGNHAAQRVLVHTLSDNEFNELEEFTDCIVEGNATIALKILSRLPSHISLRYHCINRIPSLQYFVMNHYTRTCTESIIMLVYCYIERGYDINYNGKDGEVRPLLHVILDGCLRIGSYRLLEEMYLLENIDFNIKYKQTSLLNALLNDFGEESIKHCCCETSNDCPLQYALWLLNHGADGTDCQLPNGFTVHYGHLDVLKKLSILGVTFPRDLSPCLIEEPSTLQETVDIANFITKSNANVKKLKHIARLAVRKISRAQLSDAVANNGLPTTLKGYLHLDWLDTSGRHHRRHLCDSEVLELDNSTYNKNGED